VDVDRRVAGQQHVDRRVQMVLLLTPDRGQVDGVDGARFEEGMHPGKRLVGKCRSGPR
jgi:hypothetical protein